MNKFNERYNVQNIKNMEVDGELQQGGELSTNETEKEKRDHMEEDPMSIHEEYLPGYCDSVDYERVKNLK